MKMRLLIALPLLVLTLAACGGVTEPPPPADTATPKPVTPTETDVGQSPLSPPPTPTRGAVEETSPLPTPPPAATESASAEAEHVMESAREYLARELNMDPDDVRPVSIQAVKWEDAALGCPRPEESYAQVITPGFRVVFEVDGTEYELHTDRSGTAVRICPREDESQAAVAVAYLAEQLRVPEDQIEVQSVATYDWPDTSLGCPQPGRAYAQVVTPGYRIMLEVQGDTYDVRMDVEGKIMILCDNGDRSGQ